MNALVFRRITFLVVTCFTSGLLLGAAGKSISLSKAAEPEQPGYTSTYQSGQSTTDKQLDEMLTRLKLYEDGAATVKRNLETFDTLDYVVFSGQDWLRLHESHSQDVIVNWPDGHHTNGIERHIEDLKAMFVYAPDTQIREHTVRFGAFSEATSSMMTADGKVAISPAAGGEGYTCVMGVMTGTFTKPMPLGDGKFIQPTGKAFSIPMCTVGHWENGVMTEEWLYWDNATYMKQIGIGG
jgi:hypothetical protein